MLTNVYIFVKESVFAKRYALSGFRIGKRPLGRDPIENNVK